MSAPTGERRAHARRQFAEGGSNPLIATLGLVPRAAILCDVGPGGIGLLTTLPPPLGAVVPVWLARPAGTPSILLLATIVYLEPTAEGLFRIGLSCREESIATLHAFLEELPLPGWVLL